MSESVSPTKSAEHEALYDSFVAEYYDYGPHPLFLPLRGGARSGAVWVPCRGALRKL